MTSQLGQLQSSRQRGLTRIRETCLGLWGLAILLRAVAPEGTLWDALYSVIGALFILALFAWSIASLRAYRAGETTRLATAAPFLLVGLYIVAVVAWAVA